MTANHTTPMQSLQPHKYCKRGPLHSNARFPGRVYTLHPHILARFQRITENEQALDPVTWRRKRILDSCSVPLTRTMRMLYAPFETHKMSRELERHTGAITARNS